MPSLQTFGPSPDAFTLQGGAAGPLDPVFATAALDLNFANGVYRPALGLTTTRASVAYEDDLLGNWIPFAANVPRITNKGLLVEESRTNIIRNNAMVGAVPGTPGTLPGGGGWSIFAAGGLALNVIGTGTQNGIDYIDLQFVGTSTGTFFVLAFDSPGAVASPGQAWTESFFCALVGGSLANVTAVNVDMRFTGGPPVDVSFLPTSTFTRYVNSTTATTGATNAVPAIGVSFSSGVAINVTLRIGWPQCEQGAFATSPIRTTGAAAMRAADVVSVTNPPAFGSARTLYVAATPFGSGTVTATAAEIDDGTANNYMAIQRVATFAAGTALASGGSASGGSAAANSWPNNALDKVAMASAPNDEAWVFNGGQPTTSTLASPVTLSAIRLGSRWDGTQQFNGYITRVAVWANTRLDNPTLIALTSPDSGAFDMDLTTGIYSPASLGLVCSRASVGYADYKSGVWASFANNVARQTDKGLLVEEARTNGIRNNIAAGAVVGTPGTLPTNWLQSQNTGIVPAVIGTGTDQGIDYIDLRFVGTVTAGANNNIQFEAQNVIAAASGQTWTSSYFYKLVAGSLANINSIQITLSGTNGTTNTENSQAAVPGPTSIWQRAKFTFTLANAGTTNVYFIFQLQPVPGQPIDITIRLGWPQLEQGAFPTSPIRTTGAAATRAADTVVASGTPAFGGQYTMFAAGIPNVPVSYATDQTILDLDDGTNNNRVRVSRAASSGLVTGQIIVGGGPQPSPSTATVLPQGAVGKTAMALAPGDQVLIANGAAAAIGSSSASPLFVPSAIAIGSRQSGALWFNGYITRVTVWPTQRLPNSALQALTNPDDVKFSMDFTTGTFSYPLSLNCGRGGNGIATAINSAGVWSQFPVLSPRITDLGVLVEEVRTNSLRNNSMQGAISGSPGTQPTNWGVIAPTGLTQTISLSTVNGIDCIDFNFAGTATSASQIIISCEGVSQIAAAPGQTWTASAFLQVVRTDPFLQGLSVAIQGTAGGPQTENFLGGPPVPNQATSLARYSVTGTLANPSTTNVRLQVFTNPVNNGQTVNVTLRIGWPQLEQGAFATSPIRTFTAAGVRGAENLTVANLPYFTSSFTLYAAGNPSLPTSYFASQVIAEVDDGAPANNRSMLYRSGGTGIGGASLIVGGNTILDQPLFAGATWNPSSLGKIAMAIGPNDAAFSFDGMVPIPATPSSGPSPGQMTELLIGRQYAGNYWNAPVTNIAFWPVSRRSNVELQAMTT